MPSSTFGPMSGPSPSVPIVRDCPTCLGLGVHGPGPRYGDLCERCGGIGEVVVGDPATATGAVGEGR